MPVVPDSKYALRDLHEQIDLFDRKIAYCETHEKFDSEQERSTTLQKLTTKRGTLVKNALAMAERGIQCEAKYLPRSFKKAAEPAEGTESLPSIHLGQVTRNAEEIA